MHVMSKTDLLSPEDLETVTVSRIPATLITANGSVDSFEEATVYVKDLDMFVMVQLLGDTPAVLSLGTLCEKNGNSHECKEGQTPNPLKNGKNVLCERDNIVPIVVPC